MASRTSAPVFDERRPVRQNLERTRRCGSSSMSGRLHPSKPPGFRPTGSGPASAGSTRRWGRSERQKSAAGDRLAHAPGLLRVRLQLSAMEHFLWEAGPRRSNPNTVALRASMDDLALPFVRFPGRRASTAAARASGSGGSGTRVLQAPPDRTHGMGGADAGRDREAAYNVRLPCRRRRPGMASRIDDLRRENHDQAVIRIRHWSINAPRPTAIQTGGAPSNPFASGRRTGAH